MKQSVDLMNSMKRFSFRHSNSGTYSTRRTYSTAPTSLARRALLLLTVLLMSVGSVWGATTPEPNKEKEMSSLTDQSQQTFTIDWDDIVSGLGLSALSDLNGKLSIGWYVVDGSNNPVSCNYNWSGSGYPRHSSSGDSSGSDFNDVTFVYWTHTNSWDDNFTDDGNKTNHGTIKITPSQPWVGLTVKFVVVNDNTFSGNPMTVATPSLLYTWTFVGPDDFPGTFSGTETSMSHEVASRSTSTSTVVDFSDVLTSLSGVQYARFYLEKDGEAQDISSTAITVTGGQTTSKDSRGVYVYTGSALTADNLNVTVSLPAGSYSNYQLIAVFSDDEPAEHSGMTVTKEPAALNEKYVCSFTYPTTVIDKYIDKNQNSSDDFDITSLATDLGKSLSDINSSYYIRWRINDGTSDVNFATTEYEGGRWVISSPTGGGTVVGGYAPTWNNNTSIAYLYTGNANLTTALETVGKMKVKATGSKLFSEYPNYTVICEVFTPQPTIDDNGVVTDASVPALRYVFHFADAYVATSAELTTGMTVKREHNSKLTAELDLATADHFDDVNTQFGGHLNDETNVEKLYMRWYLTDIDGNFVETPAGITFTPLYAGYADKVVSGINYGKVLHLGNAGAVVTADMLKMNVEVTDGDIDLNEYQVVCAMGYADDGYTKEPTPLKAKYVYTFESPFEGKLSPTAITHTKEVIVSSSETVKEIPLDTYFSEILTDLGTTAEDLGKNLHIRWYVMHGDERYVRSDLQLEAVDTEIGYKKHTGVSGSTNPENGSLYWNTATCGVADPLLEGKLNVQFTIPTVDKLWENYKVIAVLTNDISASSGQETADDGLGGLQLTKEPQVLNVQYIFSMIDSQFKFVHHKGASERDYFTHDDDVHITAQSGDYTMDKTTIFLPSDINVIGGRGDGFFVSDRYTLGSAKQSNIDPETGETLSKGANDLYPKFGGLTVKKDNPLKTAKFKISGIKSVVAYLVSTNKAKSRTCYATATPSDGSAVVAADGTSEHEGMTAVITLTLDPAKEYVVDFSDAREYGTENGGDMSLLGVRFVIDGTEPVKYEPEQLVQYSWDNANSRVNIAERPDIRQGVHTVHYYMYIKPTDGEKMLRLPFQYYDGSGNNLEPMAYIRWYDWTADLSSKRLVMKGTLLKELTDVAGNRGFFMLNNSVPNLQPCHNNVGVTYNPSSLTKDGDIIACDVSKYYDGLYPGTADDDRTGFEGKKYPQLVHEPTLSIRYLFHVFPSSVIVKDIKEGADRFTAALSGLTKENFAERKKTMFNLYENNGRVVVSLNGSAGDFAVRAQLQTLGEYYVYNGTDEGVQCSQIRWTSYLEDENGLWLRSGDLSHKENVGRVYSFDLSKLNGTYTHLTGSLGNKDVTAAPGMRFHIIGYIGGGGYEAPAIHYELQFLDAPAILAENLKATDVKRTIDYLNLHYREGGTVTFDNYFADLSAPTTEAENMLYTPLAWKEAQYGFCYPSIDKYRIHTSWSGLTPIHGDYMLLKSMGRAGVSKKGDNPETPSAGCKYVYWWYNEPTTVLYDCTHLRDNSKYGGYIYVDASDESRNIATLDFSASLCAGSQIYFTAAIADVTEGSKTSPQLMANVYAKNEFGERTHVMSFLTCVLNTVNSGDGGYKYNKWYQVYGHGNIPENIDITNFTDFTVEIDNYSKNTEGADFCVDQVVFYTSTGKIQVEQTGGMCEDEGLSITALMEVENLENMVTLSNDSKTLYYKFFKITSKNDNGIITFEPIDDTSIYNNGENKYGQLYVSKYVLKADGTLDDSSAEIIARNGNYVIKDGILYLKLLDNKVINLPQGYNYFIAMTKNLQAPDLNKWADPNNACEVYSKSFLPKKTFVHFLALDGDHDVVSQTVQAACGGTTAEIEYYIQANYPDDNEPSGFKSLPLGTAGSLTDDGVLFDFFLGTKEQMTANYTGYDKSLLEALQEYRAYERTTPTDGYSNALRAEYESVNPTYYNILNDAITNNLLLLRASGKFKDEVTTETTSFWAIPVNTNYTFDEKNYTICDYIPFTFTLKSGSGGPELILGFDDVDYETAGTKRVLRVGLEQLNKMRTQGYILHVPVNRFSDKYGKTDGKVYFPSDSYLTISAVDKSASPTVPNTTDPTLPAVGTKFAKIVPINSIETRPWVDKDHMYLALDLSGTNCAITFHEGYEYEVATIFYDAEDVGDLSTACLGDLYMVIKVVPEFVTWKAQHVDNDGNPTTTTTDYWSANWYNDGNWQRSTRAELYKGSGTQNTATAGHPSGYENNGEGNLSGLTTGNPGFVPMRFTYVTLPTGNHAPSLINEPRVVGTGKGARRQGGGFLDLTRTTLLTDRSPNANTDGMSLAERQNSKPTENIYYDMLVRYGEYHTGDNPDEHYGEGCFGHRYIKSDGTWDDQGVQNLTAKVFDVEKFQGNVCREIYFKPGAELLRPHRLQYEKAWVEKELDANKWYLISSPLKNTYAGDMYVPFTNGRQETEAFQPITFNTTTYSRTRYPIYQRSWGLNNGTVYVKQNDIRANSYSANLNYSGVTTSLAEWGHTYNDVQVSYNTMTAFAIRAHKKDQTDKTLIRLPKADTSYDYYDWSGDSPDPAAGTGIKTVDKVSVYKLVTDYQDDTNTETSPLEFNISTMQQQGDYVLVGNPFMVSIDMKKFFDGNTELSKDGYWTYEGSSAETHTVPTVAKTTVIKPLQAFFVKKGTATKITFTKEMQIDGNFPTPPGWTDSSNPAPALVLTAENEQGSSKANVLVGEGQNVETLFDSNLEDVPMVYTVADGQAVSINHTKDWEATGFGVVCNSPEVVEVTLTGVDNIEGELYVVDAVDGKATEVAEGQTVTVVPNEYGRYFLTRSASLGEVKAGLSEGIMVSVHGGVVSITAAKALGTVRAMSINGATVYQSSDCDNSVQFQLQQGIYVIEVAGEAGNRTMKIVVK